MTEEEAKKKWCPFVRHQFDGDEPASNRAPSDGKQFGEWACCIGSACMVHRLRLHGVRGEVVQEQRSMPADEAPHMNAQIKEAYDKLGEEVGRAFHSDPKPEDLERLLHVGVDKLTRLSAAMNLAMAVIAAAAEDRKTLQ